MDRQRTIRGGEGLDHHLAARDRQVVGAAALHMRCRESCNLVQCLPHLIALIADGGDGVGDGGQQVGDLHRAFVTDDFDGVHGLGQRRPIYVEALGLPELWKTLAEA